jgi:hypothetical protein
MKQTLTFKVDIQAPRKVVWDTMLGADTYTKWAAPFYEGSYFKGSWDEGAKIQFLAPSGDGMSSVIVKNTPHEFISIKHLGQIAQGVEDTTSDKVRAWAPAFENYTFTDANGGTRVTVSLDTAPEWIDYMNETFPKALNVLKELCEQQRA